MPRRSFRFLVPLAALTLAGVPACGPSPYKATPGVSAVNPPAPPAAPSGPPRPAGDSDYQPHPFDWPQWQGPERTAVSKETGLLQDWPAAGPKLLWEADYAGEGYSTPTVAAGRVFLMGNRDGQECVLALSEADGGQVWAAPIGAPGGYGGGFPGPRCSPTVDGDRVYALGLAGELVCLDLGTGQVRWRKNLVKDFGGSIGGWGYCESPLVDGDKLLCTPGGATATLVALNKKSGKPVWKGPVPGGPQAHYASMLAVDVGGAREYVQFLGTGVVGLSKDGRLLWQYAKPSNGTANCSTPIFHDDAVFAASNYGVGGGLVRLVPDGDAVKAEQAWFSNHMKNHHGGMVLIGGHVYGSDDARLVCLDWKTGAVKWSESKPGKGSIAAADGRLYYRNEGGPVILAEANPAKYVEHGRFTPPKGSGKNAWPHPVIANGRLYLRDQHLLYCYDVKRK